MQQMNDAEVVTLEMTEGLVLLKLTADWCGPCKQYNPVLETFADETGTPVYSLDIDNNPETPKRHAVMSIPTTLVYFDGTLRETMVGVRSLAKLKRDLAPYLTQPAA